MSKGLWYEEAIQQLRAEVATMRDERDKLLIALTSRNAEVADLERELERMTDKYMQAPEWGQR